MNRTRDEVVTMDFYKQEIYGNILYTAYRTRSLVVSVSLLYSLFGVAAILYFADKGYAAIIAGVIIVGVSLWRIRPVFNDWLTDSIKVSDNRYCGFYPIVF